jgi:uncharacterized membrane protein YbhN (UPF0104 family)
MSAALERVEGLDARFLVPALALQVGTLGLRALAWRNVLAAAYPRRVPVFSIACAYAAGVGLNGFVPARGGEGVKVALVRARVPGSNVATIASSLSVLLLLDATLGGVLIVSLWATGVLATLPLPSLPASGSIPLAVGLAALAVVLALVARVFRGRLRAFFSSLVDGLAVLRSPVRYLRTVLPFQLGAWACRIGVVYLVLHAFRIQTGLATAVLLVVLSGASTAVPVPGGAGSQQVFSAYALRGTISTAAAVSFSLAMQVGITVVNTTVGLVAAMLLFRTLRPLAALRTARAA